MKGGEDFGMAAQSTNREIWRERTDDYYAPSVFVTGPDGIGINVGGTVIVLPVRVWHQLGLVQRDKAEWLCERDRTVYPFRDGSGILQHCPDCGDAMIPTSANLREIAALRQQIARGRQEVVQSPLGPPPAAPEPTEPPEDAR